MNADCPILSKDDSCILTVSRGLSFTTWGVGLVSQTNIDMDNSIYKVIEVEGLDLYYNQFLVYHKQKRNVPVIRSFIEFAQANIGALKANCMDYEVDMHGVHSITSFS